ncbi:MAG TPA: hypothetical protein VFC06_01560, partial [Demequina sp.]|nr:hypothetical protein [Demequina sp.]
PRTRDEHVLAHKRKLQRRVHSVAERIEDRGQVEDGTLPLSAPRLEREVSRLDRTGRRVVSALLFGALLIAGAIVRPEDAGLGTGLMVASSLPFIHALFGGRRGR